MKTHQTQGTCSRAIDYEVMEGVITVGRLVETMARVKVRE